jgi:hypothetical protein
VLNTFCIEIPSGKTLCHLQCFHPVVVFGRQHNNKNKPIELLTLVLFDSCYMFLPTFGTIFRQSSQIRLLLLNCANESILVLLTTVIL